ncbi:MAG: SAM-dependent methyltransferase [Candidatus Rokuibacteriota bacterium]|nr:MAG: SAM-dependent methyltransferase [Candidatus Rokubacteria bacterium]
MLEFSQFDRRNYPTVPAREGYRAWLPSYETTVEDEMDLVLLAALESVVWTAVGCAADLGCGTGRTGAWLRAHGVARLDGIDLTPEMLAVARSRNIYDHLAEADVAATGLVGGVYDLVVTCLVDEHLRDLRPLYREASRLLRPGGTYVLVGYHPHFIMTTGIPTHFDRAPGESVAIETYVHLFGDHVAAARPVDLTLIEMRERLVDDRWIALKPRWKQYRNHPVSFAMVWRKTTGPR